MTKLTDKQQAFIANKAAGVANRDAAIAAGYSVASASVAAGKLMANPAIRTTLKAATKTTPGAETKADAPAMPRQHYADPMQFLEDAMNHKGLPIGLRADFAFKLMPYKHARIGETGKKESSKDKALKIARGRSKFATKAPPQLTVVRNE